MAGKTEPDAETGRAMTGHHIDVAARHDAWLRTLPEAAAVCRRAATLTVDRAGPPATATEISILLADDATVARLNREFRGVDGPTNVLAFPGDGPAPSVPGDRPALLGDVVVAFETAAAEARAANLSLSDHLTHLVVHGVLHLLGHDHEMDWQANIMESLEISVLDTLGIANPYREEHVSQT